MGVKSPYFLKQEAVNIRVGILTAPDIRWEQRPEGVLLHDVRIGIGFHWDRTEDQLFEGTMEIRDNGDGTKTAINTLDVEDYLTSVITSEMAATSNIELLKAHAVISRSWLLRPMKRETANAEREKNVSLKDKSSSGWQISGSKIKAVLVGRYPQIGGSCGTRGMRMWGLMSVPMTIASVMKA